MVYKVEYTNFKVETHIEDYVNHNVTVLKTRAKKINAFKLKYTKVDNQGFVVHMYGTYKGEVISSWWTGLSLRDCTDKIIEDFLSKYYIKVHAVNTFENNFRSYKSYPMDSFGFPTNS